MSLFTNKTLLITGGTGSFGNAVLNRFLNENMCAERKLRWLRLDNAARAELGIPLRRRRDAFLRLFFLLFVPYVVFLRKTGKYSFQNNGTEVPT